ncbi:MAG: cytochrome P450 [Verrucomicrobiota bacterium JB022]|nr:cytochrome P450 [Verrucomicrobiota bacterium JB022]
MAEIPRTHGFDCTAALLKEGYTFISRRCEAFQSDIFETRLALRRAYCIRGPEAAQVFYEGGHFSREGAMPPTTLRLLQDKGSVQSLEGEAHLNRKKLFMSLMSPEGIARVGDLFEDAWRERMAGWGRADSVVLHPEAQAILCRAGLQWLGIPHTSGDLRDWTRDLAAMIENAGRMSPRVLGALIQRQRAELRGRRLIEDVRAGRLQSLPEGALQRLADHRDLDGQLLDPSIASVELLNLLRPLVAVARYITFIAASLHEQHAARPQLDSRDAASVERWVQEVRRFYPFFPLIGGRATRPVRFKGHLLPRSSWVLLDLYGTNRDPRTWDAPEAFRPDRFIDWEPSLYNFIPQGAGDHFTTHRCPGEMITVEVMRRAVRLLTMGMRYEVPPQDLSIPLDQMPTLPRSGFIMRRVQGSAA